MSSEIYNKPDVITFTMGRSEIEPFSDLVLHLGILRERSNVTTQPLLLRYSADRVMPALVQVKDDYSLPFFWSDAERVTTINLTLPSNEFTWGYSQDLHVNMLHPDIRFLLREERLLAVGKPKRFNQTLRCIEMHTSSDVLSWFLNDLGILRSNQKLIAEAEIDIPERDNILNLTASLLLISVNGLFRITYTDTMMPEQSL